MNLQSTNSLQRTMSLQRTLTANALVAGLLVVLLTGCSAVAPGGDASNESGNDSSSPVTDGEFTEVLPQLVDPYEIRGRIDLPDPAMDSTTLRVSNGYDEAGISTDGSFAINSIVNLPGLSTVVDEQDRVVLLGFMSSDGSGVLNAKSTAAALIYYAIGGWTIPAERTPELIEAIEGTTACDNLAATIESELAADPGALQSENDVIQRSLLRLAGLALTQIRSNASSKSSLGLSQKQMRARVSNPMAMANFLPSSPEAANAEAARR